VKKEQAVHGVEHTSHAEHLPWLVFQRSPGGPSRVLAGFSTEQAAREYLTFRYMQDAWHGQERAYHIQQAAVGEGR
jgi:hypothetical protein